MLCRRCGSGIMAFSCGVVVVVVMVVEMVEINGTAGAAVTTVSADAKY